MIAAVPRQGLAITRWNGVFTLEDTYAEGPDGSNNLFQGGLSLDIRPPIKKQLNAVFNLRLNYTAADGKALWNISPIGNLSVDLAGESYSMNLQHSRLATVTTSAELVETTTSRAGFALFRRDLPGLVTSYSTTETTFGDTETRTNSFSLFSDYKYKWMNFRGGYSRQERESGDQPSLSSDSTSFGLGGNYEILPKTSLTGDFDINRFTSGSAGGAETVTVGKVFRLGALTRPAWWFDLGGNYTKEITEVESERATSTSSRYTDLTAGLYPIPELRLFATVGNREFDDIDRKRSVDFNTIGASFLHRLMEKIQLGLNASRTRETDLDQGKNIRDNFGLNSVMDLTPRASLRVNLNINRNESPAFVSSRDFDASGILSDRALFDDRPAGFTFFDTVNNDLYTKLSSLLGDWSPPQHIEPVTETFSINESVQLNMIPTDKTILALFYSANSSSEELDFTSIDSQNLSSSLTYQPNRRTGYSLTGTVLLPKTGDESYSGTASMAYRFYRGHQAGLSYGRSVSAGRTTDNTSGNLRLALRKRSTLDLTYSISQLFKDDQSNFIRVRYSKSF
ncbi:MAG: hypothetical protein C4526_08905 [Nitrospiraceae bacterium]|nr:MAG: hypothetical protein C4526_08905 [Nitrospiraceae bacterium]